MAEQGYTEPTPIQAQAIPPILAGRDLLGAAQTGTGKTAGFTLPMLQRLAALTQASSQAPAATDADAEPPGDGQLETQGQGGPAAQAPRRRVRALILTPTRELAAQVQDSVRTYGKFVQLRSTTIFGGVNINPQIAELRRGVDILVATPGRLLDHVQQRTVDLRHVEILVLDEADRMLDMGFIHDMRRIVALVPRERQTLLFSATFSEEIRKLAAAFQRDPVTVEVARRNTPAELVAQVAHPVDRERKRELLSHLVKTHNWQQVLVFCKTKHGANRLAQQLERDGIDADAIHGNKSQPARTRALKRFKDGELQVLVATDIAARGLDIEALPHVVNYDLPNVSEDYVHRIGRTGRAGESGDAVSLVSHEDRPLLSAIERLMNRKVEQRVIEGFEPGTPSLRAPDAEDRTERPPRQQQPRRENRGQPGQGQPRHRQGQAGQGQGPGQGQRRPRPGGQPQGSRPFRDGRNNAGPSRPTPTYDPNNPNPGLDQPMPGLPLQARDLPPAEERENQTDFDLDRYQPVVPGVLGTPPARTGQGRPRGPGGPRRGGGAGGGAGGGGQPAGRGPRPGAARRSGAPGQGKPRRNDGRPGRPGGPGAGGQPGRRGPGGPGRPSRPIDPMEAERLRQLQEGKRMARGEPRETPQERAEREAAASRKTVKRGPISTVVAYLKRRVA